MKFSLECVSGALPEFDSAAQGPPSLDRITTVAHRHEEQVLTPKNEADGNRPDD